ncbi:hypothetical protein BGX26_002365 [Mortierella sp. AD094]|nr:hypothetical protein BGX26_002365 [Mortierella sp. AD094]
MDGLKVLQLVALSTSLQCLSFKTVDSNKDFPERMISTMESHPGLKKLVLHTSRFDGPIAIQRLIQACRRLHSLRLRIDRMGSKGKQNPHKKLTLARDAIHEMSDTQLQELSIYLYEEVEPAVILPLLERSPLLERLELPQLHSRDALNQIAHILQAKERSRLKHLHLGSISTDEKVFDELFRAVGCDINAGHSDRFFKEESGLLSFKVDFWPEPARPVLKFLPRYLASTLADLNLGRFYFPIQLIADILHRLPNLKSLVTGMPLEPDEADDIDALSQMPWSCFRLTKLHLCIRSRGVSGRIYIPDWRDLKSRRSIEYLFSQIGKLTELEELGIGANVDLLVLEDGYLGQLAELKRLRRLDLRSYRGQLFTENVRWMIEHWKRLSCFVVSFSFIPHWFQGSGQARPYNSAIEELLSRRPRIQIMMEEVELL